MSSPEYVLGTDDAELQRLAFQHALWRGEAVEQWHRAGFAPGMTILDVGAGPGFAARDLAQILGPRGSILAVDESARYLEFLAAQPARVNAAPIGTHVMDVQAMDLRESSFDGAYARWVLSFTPDPEAVVGGVARALKPGGGWAVQDYCGWEGIYWAPLNRTLPSVIEAVTRVYHDRRADYRVGRILPSLMERHGLEVREIRPLLRSARPGEALWEWPGTFFRTFLPRLVEQGYLTQAEFEAWRAEWGELGKTPGAYFMTPPQVLVIAARR